MFTDPVFRVQDFQSWVYGLRMLFLLSVPEPSRRLWAVLSMIRRELSKHPLVEGAVTKP